MISKGLGVSEGIAKGKAFIYTDKDKGKIPNKDFILVCDATYPNMVPIMVKAKGIVVRFGGLLSHSAIVSRELGIPCIVYEPILRKINNNQIIEINGKTGVIKFI